MIDKRRFQQVLLNLLTNACKFQKKGKVHVRSSLKKLDEQDNDFALEVKVIDKGIGIDQNDAKNLFQPFMKSENKLNKQHNPRGNGMGLSISKQICQALGGDIRLEQTSQEGSIFTFSVKAFKTTQFCEDIP